MKPYTSVEIVSNFGNVKYPCVM